MKFTTFAMMLSIGLAMLTGCKDLQCQCGPDCHCGQDCRCAELGRCSTSCSCPIGSTCGDPIVSPDKISDKKAGDGEIGLKPQRPWWK